MGSNFTNSLFSLQLLQIFPIPTVIGTFGITHIMSPTSCVTFENYFSGNFMIMTKKKRLRNVIWPGGERNKRIIWAAMDVKGTKPAVVHGTRPQPASFPR